MAPNHASKRSRGSSPRAADSAESSPLKGAASAPVLLSGDERRGGGGGRRGGLGWAIWLALLTLAGMALVLHSADSSPTRHTSFIRVAGTQFVLDCRPFYIAGFNVDNIAQAPLPQLARRLAGGRSGVALVRGVFQQAAQAGLNVVRTFAHTTDPAYPLQVRPGVYDQEVFRGLDRVIAEAERAGLRVILSLADSWKHAGGMDEFVDWSSTAPKRDPRYPPANRVGDVSMEDYSPERLKYENARKALFYTDDGARQLYKDHVRAVLERRNSVSGRLYRDDPAIMAFDLLNEPRCSAYETLACTDIVNKWVLDMAQHFKSLDQQHLVTLGAEGFWGERDAFRGMNPGAPDSDWASKAGQDFINNHNVPQIDFAAFHLWPTNWKVAGNLTFNRQWIDKHVEDCEQMLKKPCLLAEYGHALGTRGLDPPAEAIASQRDPAFAAVLEAVEGAVGQVKPLGGSLYWRWGLSVYQNDVPGVYGVLPNHSTFKLVAEHAQRLRAHMLGAAPAHECGQECWVPAESLFGLLRRCEHRPSVCAEARARRQYQKSFDMEGGRLVARGPHIYASQAECCRPGLGGFVRGCSTTWF